MIIAYPVPGGPKPRDPKESPSLPPAGLKSSAEREGATMPGLLLRDARPWPGKDRSDLLVRDGVLARIGPRLSPEDTDEVVDLGGRLVLPGLVEAHCHLDKTLFGGPWRPHSACPTRPG
jgi:hypothetical protein